MTSRTAARPWGCRSPSARPDAFSTGPSAALDPLTERLAAESFPRQAHRASERRRNAKNARSLRLTPEDIDALKRGIGRLMEPVAEAYYLEAVGEAEVVVGQEAIRITVPIRTTL